MHFKNLIPEYRNLNTLGHTFKVSSFGESHGAYVGCVIDACPANIAIDLDAIQHQVNRRKTAKQAFASGRQEEDTVEIVSGIFEGKTLGTPICILIRNKDARSQDYDNLKEVYRPNHADMTYDLKYGHRDHRGGGRSSIRITAPLVAAGELARQILLAELAMKEVSVKAFVSQIGSVKLQSSHQELNLSKIDDYETRCPDEPTDHAMQALIAATQEEGDTLGGIIECVIQKLPAGIGSPVFGKLQAQLAHAMFSINTVKGFEYGDGFSSASQKGSQHNDEILSKEHNRANTATNHSGGIQGGISNGEEVVFRVAFKPISSMAKAQQTINTEGKPTSISIAGRHDVCAVPRAVPIVEAYTWLTLADLYLNHKIHTH